LILLAQITVPTSILALVALVPTIRTVLLAKLLTTVNGAIISVLAKQRELFQMELLLAKFLLVFRAIPTAKATEIRAALRALILMAALGALLIRLVWIHHLQNA